MRRKHSLIPGLILLVGALALAACSGAQAAALPESAGIEIQSERGEVEFTGVVEALGSEQWTVSGVPLAVNADTEIHGDPALADTVKVHAFLDADGLLTAREIELAESEDADDKDGGDADEVEFRGTVEAISPDSWSVSGTAVLVTPATEVKGEIVLGDLVKVHARRNEEGVLEAREIELTGEDDLEDDDGDLVGEIEFTGIVEAIGAGSWTVGGRTVIVTVQTEIEPGITVGDEVKVHASPNDSGVLVAREIDPAEPDDDNEDELEEEREFLGSVESISDSVWVIDGVTVTITSQTEIDAGLQVGSLVEVEALVASDGSLIAEEIEHADESDLEDQDEADDDEHDDDLDDDDQEEGDDQDEHEDEDEDEDRSGSNSGSD